MRYRFSVPDNDLAEAALVLLGHGSTKNAESAAPVYQQATELRGRELFAEVREAFWKQEPQAKQVLANLSARWIFIVPLFVSEGYFSSQIIPAIIPPFIRPYAKATWPKAKSVTKTSPIAVRRIMPKETYVSTHIF